MHGVMVSDGWVLAAIAAKAIGYALALLAVGGTLFIAIFRELPIDVAQLVKRIILWSILIGALVLALRFGIRAARISGMGIAGMTEPVMLGLVWNSPLGTAALWSGAGWIMMLGLLRHGLFWKGVCVAGTLLVAFSYSRVGHALGAPGWLPGVLLTVHIMAAAFWAGALIPLYKLATRSDGPQVLHRFGYIAMGGVGVLIAVGVVFAALMLGSVSALVTTAYGWVLLLKLATVATLLGVAALNKWRYVPSLALGERAAIRKLQRSIRIEAVLIGAILLLTATLTTSTTPPVNM